MDEQQMAAWMETANPSTEHEFLKKLVGTWKSNVKMWMQPGAPPVESTGTMTNEMILGGRFLRSSYAGGSPMGGEFGGLAIDGFNRIEKKYVGIWIDTMSTSMMFFEGTAEGNVRTSLCKFTDPRCASILMKAVTTIVNDNEHCYESFAQPEGATEFVKNMEITYTRA
jgi:hypothetical protein